MSSTHVTRDAEFIRVGDADRHACVDALNQHYAEGRLSKDELDGRQHAALTASTSGDLHLLVADLPHLTASMLERRRPEESSSRLARLALPPVVLAAAAIIVPAVFNGPSDVGLFAATLGTGVLGYISHWAITKKRYR
ncbi:MAG TPA: DUF1707 domain-containing protein [Propionibacteriaceae bacterium]|nr:DUF1707 domain-containing protein [Propionibacteriaceae bacterium]